MYAVPNVAAVASDTNALAPTPEVTALGIDVPVAEYTVVASAGAVNTPVRPCRLTRWLRLWLTALRTGTQE